VKPETKLADDLEIDSIKAIEIVVAMEKKYKVSIRDEDISRIASVQQIFDLLQNLTHKQLVHE
jgi:acyl carrier protein